MHFRMTIGRKIGMGFGLFIFFALLVVLLTNRTLERSRHINDQINHVYSPSVDALVHLRNVLVNAHMLIKHWAQVESIPDAPEKTAFVELTTRDLPAVLGPDRHAFRTLGKGGGGALQPHHHGDAGALHHARPHQGATAIAGELP